MPQTKINKTQVKFSIFDLVDIDSSFDGVVRFRGVYSGTTFPTISNPRKGDMIIWEETGDITYIKTYIYTGSLWYMISSYHM